MQSSGEPRASRSSPLAAESCSSDRMALVSCGNVASFLAFLRQRAPSCPLLLQETVNAVELHANYYIDLPVVACTKPPSRCAGILFPSGRTVEHDFGELPPPPARSGNLVAVDYIY